MINMAIQTANEKQQMEGAYGRFVGRYPEYAETTAIDRLRSTDYRRLDEHGQVYLDYTGGSLYAESQLEQHLVLLRDHSHRPIAVNRLSPVGRTRTGLPRL